MLHMLPVVEIFESLQGEGLCIGRPTTFIRLAGCNLRCRWCDTRYAYERVATERLEPQQIAAQCRSGRDVCLTGGEPLLHNIMPLAELLLERGHRVSIETNGSLPLPEHPAAKKLFWSVSPKFGSSGETPNYEMLAQYARLPATQIQWKLVFRPEDWPFACALAREVIPPHHPVIFTPEGSGWRTYLQWAWDRLLAEGLSHTEVRLLPQLHIIAWGNARCK